jgi:hypothetical protein
MRLAGDIVLILTGAFALDLIIMCAWSSGS